MSVVLEGKRAGAERTSYQDSWRDSVGLNWALECGGAGAWFCVELSGGCSMKGDVFCCVTSSSNPGLELGKEGRF